LQRQYYQTSFFKEERMDGTIVVFALSVAGLLCWYLINVCRERNRELAEEVTQRWGGRRVERFKILYSRDHIRDVGFVSSMMTNHTPTECFGIVAGIELEGDDGKLVTIDYLLAHIEDNRKDCSKAGHALKITEVIGGKARVRWELNDDCKVAITARREAGEPLR